MSVTIDTTWLKSEARRGFRSYFLLFSLAYVVMWYLLTFRPNRAWAYIEKVAKEVLAP